MEQQVRVKDSSSMIQISTAGRKVEGLPQRFATANLNTFKAGTPSQWAAQEALTDYCDHILENLERGRSIILWGAVGSGKTHLGISVIKAAAAADKSNLIVTEDRMFDTFKANWNDPEKENAFLLQLQRVRFLMLDDMGVRKASEYVSDRYEAVINSRYEKVIPTIITTNLSPGRMLELYERQMSRLMHDGLVLEVIGPDGRVA